MNGKNVHTEHCCKEHGCKYGDELCPVVDGTQKQSYPCEECGEDVPSELEILKSAVREYLKRPSTDGRPDRQTMRKQLSELSSVQTDYFG
jgi:hypothetical protein